MHGLSLKQHTQGAWDWELSASLYDYGKDLKRQNAAGNTLPGAASGGAGTLADGSGTGDGGGGGLGHDARHPSRCTRE